MNSPTESIISLNQMQDTSTTHENQIYATGKFAIPSIGERIGSLIDHVLCWEPVTLQSDSVTEVSGIYTGVILILRVSFDGKFN